MAKKKTQSRRLSSQKTEFRDKKGDENMIKLIAVDMDGTFLNDMKDYNRQRFDMLFDMMKTQNVEFVVASGNQYYQLRSFFPRHKEMSFVSDNGANVIHHYQDVDHEVMPWDTVHKVFDIVGGYEGVNILVCGKQSAYLTKQQTQEFYDLAINYNHRIQWVDSLNNIADDILKFALIVKPQDLEAILEDFHRVLGDGITPVTSGHTAIDLIQPGVHKAKGIEKIQKILNVNDSEILAFGDNDNDIEMLKKAGIGVAVGNARPGVKDISNVVLEKDNNSEAILDFIEAILVSQQ